MTPHIAPSFVVFLVSSGMYSDYTIEGIFSSEALAKRYIKEQKKKDPTITIEMWTVNSEWVNLEYPDESKGA